MRDYEPIDQIGKSGLSVVDLFGETPRDTHDYVGWIFSQESNDFISESPYQAEHGLEVLICQAHKFLSQPMQREWFERPAKPIDPSNSSWAEDYEDLYPGQQSQMDDFEEAWGNYENHQPLFEGEWRIDNDGKKSVIIKGQDFWIGDFGNTTLNDFLFHTKHIDKKYNKEFRVKEEQ